MNNSFKAQHAIVIGGSIAGLLTARVLADRFQQVTLIEKDQVIDEPVPRKGVPQGRHLHGLLAQGRTVLEAYYPGLSQELVAQGAISGDMGETMRWYHFGGYKKQFTSGLTGLLMSRPLLEMNVRRRTLKRDNIIFRTGSAVRELLSGGSPARVTGVRLEPSQQAGQSEELRADLVVDATGRGSATPRWLSALGYAKLHEEEVKINLSYASRIYRRQEGQLQGAKLVMVAPQPPHDKRAAIVFPIEGDRWIITISGLVQEPCPTDEAAFLQFTQSLCAPDVYNLIRQCEPLSEIVPYKFPHSLRRHYEQVKAFPEGILVIGDAACSFNPIFGQGMTSAVLQAQALEQCLQNTTTLEGLWKHYFKAIAKVVDIPWKAASGEDFRYPQVQGKRPTGINLINSYTKAVHLATQRDVVIYKAFLEVMNLMSPPESLMRPAIMWRVLKDVVQHQRSRKAPLQEEPTSLSSPVAGRIQ